MLFRSARQAGATGLPTDQQIDDSLQSVVDDLIGMPHLKAVMFILDSWMTPPHPLHARVAEMYKSQRVVQ